MREGNLKGNWRAAGRRILYTTECARSLMLRRRLPELVPEANVAYAHGQMKETELENIMYRFINGEIDVLVSTTITRRDWIFQT